MSKAPTPDQLQSLAKVLECADERLTMGWNAKDETTRSMEMSLGTKMVEQVKMELCMMASRLEEMQDAARKQPKGA